MKYKRKFQHFNGAWRYESESGQKVFWYDDQWFKTMNDVKLYILEETRPKPAKDNTEALKLNREIEDVDTFFNMGYKEEDE